jgi:hypothetical protein
MTLVEQESIYNACGTVILTAPSESVASIKTRLRFGEIALLLGWNGLWGWGDWGIRELSSGLGTVSSIAVVANSAHVASSSNLDHTINTPIGSPRVLDKPEVFSILSAIANNQNSMVNFR